jgi:hypothetical protein
MSILEFSGPQPVKRSHMWPASRKFWRPLGENNSNRNGPYFKHCLFSLLPPASWQRNSTCLPAAATFTSQLLADDIDSLSPLFTERNGASFVLAVGRGETPLAFDAWALFISLYVQQFLLSSLKEIRFQTLQFMYC